MVSEAPLSERELDVLRLVAEGLTNREIAQKLSISHNTVKVHLSNIFEKIGVSSRTEATVYAIEHRIVSVPGGEAAPASGTQGLRELVRQFRWVWLAMLVLLLLIGLTLTTNLLTREATPETIANVDVSERWRALAPMPEPRVGMAAVAYADDIFTIAGKGPEGASGEVFRYSQAENAWQSLTPKPTPVYGVQGALIGEKIYVPGGLTTGGLLVNTLEIYDPRQDSWETGAPLPVFVANYALADFEGLLYLFGGTDGEQPMDIVWIYDPTENKWSAGTALSSPREKATALSLTDKIVVIGGENKSGLLDIGEVYFPSRDASGEDPWAPFVSLPQGRADFGAANIFNSVYLLGGEVDKGGQSGLIMTEDQWVPLPANRNYMNNETRLVSIESQLFVLEPEPDLGETQLWSYQAYYSIYIPFMP
jgi:DNA-binding CsgD family transcriptional regulator